MTYHRAFALTATLALLVGLLLVVLAQGPARADQGDSVRHRVAVASLVTGNSHSCALLRTGAVKCWGYNGEGPLGYGNTDTVGDDETPASKGRVPVGGTVTALAAGYEYTCALLRSGAVRCWGRGDEGQLGYNSTDGIAKGGATKSIKQAGNVPLGGRAIAITTGDHHTCALLASGRVRCWGRNDSGQLGYNHTDPVGAGGGAKTIKQAGNVPVGALVQAISAGGSHTCALLRSGRVRCWGAPSDGQLGYGDGVYVGNGQPGSKTIKQAGNVPTGVRAVALTSGYTHNCVLHGAGRMRCWGEGFTGALGHDSQDDVGKLGSPTIKQTGDVKVGAKVVGVHAGDFHTCATLMSGRLRCWGDNFNGQLGYDTTQNVGDGVGPSVMAAGDVPVGGTVAAADGGSSHTCAALASGRVRCWGRNNGGELGYGNTDPVGSGGGNKSIQQAGNVPVGAKVRVRAATRLSMTRKPKRDRSAPYVYRVRGAVNGAFVKDAATCGGKVRIVVKRGPKTLATTTTGVNNRCRYAKRVQLSAKQLGTRKPVKLAILARHTGTTNLRPSPNVKRVAYAN